MVGSGYTLLKTFNTRKTKGAGFFGTGCAEYTFTKAS